MINNGYFPYWYDESGAIWDGPSDAPGVTGVVDETAFSSGSGQAITGSWWLQKMTKLAGYAQAHALTLVFEQSYRVTPYMTDITSRARNDLQWDMANYLLAKGGQSYFFWGGASQYGRGPILQHELERVQSIGRPTDNFHQSQGVYMRDFTRGLALVNPTSSSSYTMNLPIGRYQDLYGKPVGSYTIPPGTGVVLLVPSPVATTTDLERSSGPLSYAGQSLKLTAAVQADLGWGPPTGTVTFREDGAVECTQVLDASGNATCTTRSLTGGVHTFVAKYARNSRFASSTSPTLTQSVVPAGGT
jgi:hypothetical protein